jgi:hypothetical protein
MNPWSGIKGVGLGLRRDFIAEVVNRPDLAIDFMEIAPDNWLHLGGRYAKLLAILTERTPFVCHGLSLDLGGPRPLDLEYVHELKNFFKQHQIRCFTEHLSYCGDSGHLYDLMPIPFTEEAVHYVAGRIRTVQDVLERRIGIENVSFYAMPSSEMTESEFINAVVNEADCGLLLDVNNIYVNSINHRYDAEEFMRTMPTERIMYCHMAGHFDEAEDLKIDTHGQPVKEEVWALLDETYRFHGVQPTLLERDFNIPPLEELMDEVELIRQVQQQALSGGDDEAR